MREIITILFDNFETLDVFGPVEILGRLKEDFVYIFSLWTVGLLKAAKMCQFLLNHY